MVRADGSIRTVDAAEEPELAVALRGSGSQFGKAPSRCCALSSTNRAKGIATRYDIKAYPIGQVWGGMRMYEGGKADEIYSALHNFVPSDDEKAAIILTDVTAIGSARIFLIFYYYEGEEPPTTGPFAQFLNIDSTIDTTSKKSYSELVS